MNILEIATHAPHLANVPTPEPTLYEIVNMYYSRYPNIISKDDALKFTNEYFMKLAEDLKVDII